MSWQDHAGDRNSRRDSCQDPGQVLFVRIPAGKFRFPARFFISRQDPGRKRDSWRDPAGIPVAILQGLDF